VFERLADCGWLKELWGTVFLRGSGFRWVLLSVNTPEYGYTKDKLRVSDYTIALDIRLSRKQKLLIEACDRGSIARFINHSCSANCAFFEVQNRLFVTVVAMALESIAPDTEVTVDYGDSLWFECLCGAENCRGVSGLSD
ncbi:hypothetical protein JG687_00011228, partial [Phytophthora cactorum]